MPDSPDPLPDTCICPAANENHSIRPHADCLASDRQTTTAIAFGRASDVPYRGRPELVPELPVDVALALAGTGVDPDLHGDGLIDALRRVIADRRGSVHGPFVVDIEFTDDLFHPERMAFWGRTTELGRLAWCLVYLIGERGEVGIQRGPA